MECDGDTDEIRLWDFPVGFLRTWEKPGNSWLRLEPWPLILAKLNCIGQDSGNPWMVWKIERSINYVNFDIKTHHIYSLIMRYLNPNGGYIPQLTAIDISWAERKF
jgi:hypothetical protein